MAELVAIKHHKPFSPKEEDVKINHKMQVISKRHGLLCQLVGGEELRKAIATNSCAGGRFSILASSAEGETFELFFETTLAF